MRNLLKAGFGLAALSVVLASCGSASTPDGSASLQVTDLRTEYVDVNTGGFVACDNVFGTYSSTNRTAVAVNFRVTGTARSANVGLRGNTTSAYDGNYNGNTSDGQLIDQGNGRYQYPFYADSSQGLLPQGIVVAPAGIKIKNVQPTTQSSGSFYAALTVYSTTGSSASTDTRLALIPSVKVYASCDYLNTTNTSL